MKYAELVKQGQLNLFKAGINDHDYDAWILVEKICRISRTEYFAKMQEEVPDDIKEEFFRAIEKRTTHYPLQYIVGEWEFMGLPFEVNENVLIPRQDTELLVEKTISVINKEYDTEKTKIKVLDMCTGSGCIAISIADMVPNIEMTAVDLSADALKVAKKNADLNKVTNISFIKSDLFDKVRGKYSIIVSNPPYIKSEEVDRLMPEVRDYEPRMALDGDEDGLKFYKRIISECDKYLENDGSILFEIGYDQAEQVKQLLQKNGFADIEVLKDLSGNDRVVTGKRRKDICLIN